MFNPNRLIVARKRRRLSSKALADSIGVSPVTMSRIEQGRNAPDGKTLESIVSFLGFPYDFFCGEDIEELSKESASFRSLTSMTARERDAALTAGSFAWLVSDWVSERFNLPKPDLLDLCHERDPIAAALSIRHHWGLGEKPIGNMIKLLESKGVKVFSLSENTKNVDAFSCWRNDEPYVFLNTFKSAERSRMDAAHELGHLVLHRHGGTQNDHKRAEDEANSFAAAFLMPESDVRSHISRAISLEQLLAPKKRWGVSLAALVYRIGKLGILTEWQYRNFCIQINQRGFRVNEPNPMGREKSVVWDKVFTNLWSDGISRNHIAKSLQIPHEEIENLVFGLTGDVEAVDEKRSAKKPVLRVVK